MDLHVLKQPLSICFLLLFLLLVIWDIMLQLSPLKTTTANYAYNLGYGVVFIFGSIIGIRGALDLSLKSTIGKALFFLSLALFLYAIGQGIWAYNNLSSNIAIPYPSLADLFFILFIPCMGMAVTYIARMFLTSITKKIFLQALFIPILPAIIIFAFLNTPDLSSHLSLLTKICNIAYPLGDVVLISLAILLLRITGGKIYTGILFLIAGLLSQAGADLLFSYRTSSGTYWNGDISDVLFALSSILLSLSIVALLSNVTPERSPVQKT
ncbi:hypothetical protein BH11PAT1_BH11PAT1_0200 [soil metagenome]